MYFLYKTNKAIVYSPNRMSTRGCIAIVVVVVVLLGAVGVFGSFRIESYQPTSNNPTEVVEQTLVTKPSPTEVRVVSKQLSDKKTTLKCAQFSDMTFYDAKCSLNDDLLRGDHMEFLTTRRMATGQNATSLYPCVRPHTNIDERPVILWVAEIPRMTQNPLECPVKCQLNSKRDAASVNEADAFVVDLARKWEEDKHIYDWKTNPSNKVLIAWNIENLEGRRKSLARSYKGRYLGKDWTPDFWDSFNLSISYPMGSDIPLNYYNWALCRDKATSQAVQSFRNLKASDKVLRAAAFFSSNCQFTAHWRDAVVLFLKKYFPIHSYGRCQHTHDVKDVKWCRGVSSARSVIKACTLSRYPFTIIIENSASLDYVTEKVYEPLGVGSVPVYLGAPNIENFLPTSHSVIKISDFPSLQSLSKYLNCLLDNPDLLQYYIDWDTRVKFKSWEVFSNAYPPLCQACIRIRNKQLNGPRHPSFIDYIIPENVDSQKPLKKCFDIAVR